ncbi:aspartyl protease [Chitinophaga polysaccharea]|uniref:Aspartyl protease n=1 Tax=Chitinophaga polysaccharea TaxID=1293035 RepID=A0A561PUD6_9BACT|nr:retropepsin-like aspartic protease [Chitinophaga polysaccharea]TWF41729.1 aspartyl protease [Chitinophaga polysaccharea]
MKYVLYALTLLLLPLTTFCQQPVKDEIPFNLLPSGHILVKATIDNVPGNFIFDTGAGISLFTKQFFEKLKDTLREDGGYTGFRATGERMDIPLYHVRNFEFGSLKKDWEEVSYFDVNLGGIDGILSLKLLENQPFTIDFDKKVLRLESAKALTVIRKTAKKMGIQLEQSRDKSLTIFSYFKINDQLQLQLSLDAGAGKDVYRLHSKYLQPLGININDTAAVKKLVKRSEFQDGFTTNIYLTQVSKMAAVGQPDVAVQNFPVQFVDGLIYDGIIWINWLGSKITFDLEQQALWIER